jgi:hypothetical protein
MSCNLRAREHERNGQDAYDADPVPPCFVYLVRPPVECQASIAFLSWFSSM